MNSTTLAFLRDLNFGIIDENDELTWQKKEDKVTDFLNEKPEPEFDFHYIDEKLFILSGESILCFDYERKDNIFLVKSLSLPSFHYIKKNIKKVRRIVDET